MSLAQILVLLQKVCLRRWLSRPKVVSKPPSQAIGGFDELNHRFQYTFCKKSPTWMWGKSKERIFQQKNSRTNPKIHGCKGVRSSPCLIFGSKISRLRSK